MKCYSDLILATGPDVLGPQIPFQSVYCVTRQTPNNGKVKSRVTEASGFRKSGKVDTYSREFHRIPENSTDTTSNDLCSVAQLYTSIALFLRHAADAKIPRSVMQVAKVMALPLPSKVVDPALFPKISGGKLKIVPNPVEKRARGSADPRKRIASHATQRQSQIQSDGSIGIQEKWQIPLLRLGLPPVP